MFLKVEDLTGEVNSAAQGHGAHRVQRQSERSEAWHERAAGEVKTHNCCQYQKKALREREVVPVSRDKQQDPGGHHD